MEVRRIVLPGELVDKRNGRKLWSGVYIEGDNVFSKVLGIPRITENEISVIPLSGVYRPRVGNRVIGVITGVEISGWSVDINSPYTAFLPLVEAVGEFVDKSRTDISKFYDIDDIVYCRVSKVTKDKTVQVNMKAIGSRRLYNGIIIKITPTKVPRVIGKGGSMINLLKNKTACEIVVGQNGIVWIRGLNKAKVIEAILKIEKESHVVGLTEKIENMLSE